MASPFDLVSLGLDWDLALRRFARDIRDDFFPDPIRYADLTNDRSRTIRELRSVLSAFVPSPAWLLDVPKAGLTLRCCLQLRPVDRIVYQALVDAIADDIERKLSSAVYNHRLRAPGHDWMFRSGVEQWKLFERDISTDLCQSPDGLVVCTDITQFFEHLDFYKLKRHLEMLAEPLTDRKREIIATLIACLRIWSPFQYEGLPQNLDPSSFIGSAYLDYVDQRMLADGYRYRRYMDDIRVIVATEADARIALKKLTSYLRAIGMGLNSAKTSVVAPGMDEHARMLAGSDVNIDAIEEALKSREPHVIRSAIPGILATLRVLIANGQTNTRAFRFCVNRMAGLFRAREFDVPDVTDITDILIRALIFQPADTDTICRYLAVAPLSDRHVRALVHLLTEEPRCVYEWQNYHLWNLAVQRRIKADALLRKAHRLRETAVQAEIAGASLYLGAFGGYADRDAVRGYYTSELPLLTRRAVCIAVQELHPAERTNFYRLREHEEVAISGLRTHLEEQKPGYVPDPEPLRIDELRDAMPDVIS
jgi:hypothetical protein